MLAQLVHANWSSFLDSNNWTCYDRKPIIINVSWTSFLFLSAQAKVASFTCSRSKLAVSTQGLDKLVSIIHGRLLGLILRLAARGQGITVRSTGCMPTSIALIKNDESWTIISTASKCYSTIDTELCIRAKDCQSICWAKYTLGGDWEHCIQMFAKHMHCSSIVWFDHHRLYSVCELNQSCVCSIKHLIRKVRSQQRRKQTIINYKITIHRMVASLCGHNQWIVK